MKKAILFVVVICFATAARTQYKPWEQGSSLKFTIKNIGFGVDGSFSGFEGNINFDPQNLNNSKFDVTIDAATVNTGNSLRDEHLRGDNYFDVKGNPRIRMVSTRILNSNRAGTFFFNGELTIRGKSQAISFPFTASPVSDGYVFSGSFKIKRKDFGVGGTSTISDELEVTLSVTAKKQA